MDIKWAALAPVGTLVLGYLLNSLNDLVRDARSSKAARREKSAEHLRSLEQARDEFRLGQLRAIDAALVNLLSEIEHVVERGTADPPVLDVSAANAAFMRAISEVASNGAAFPGEGILKMLDTLQTPPSHDAAAAEWPGRLAQIAEARRRVSDEVMRSYDDAIQRAQKA